MTTEIKPPASNPQTLQDRIRQELSCPSGQFIRIHQVSETQFRINWFAPYQNKGDSFVAVFRVAKSQFVKAVIGPNDILQLN